MGLFSRKQNVEDAGGTPVVSDDSVAEENIATVNEIASAIVEEIKSAPTFDPSVWKMILEIARFYYDGSDREVSTITATLVVSGYLLRKREVSSGVRSSTVEETDGLLFSPLVESLGKSATSGYDLGDLRGDFPGFKRTLFCCFGFNDLPFQSETGEDGDARSLIPGHSWFIRGTVEFVLREEFGWEHVDEEGYLMKGEYVRRGAFGSGYMLRLLEEGPSSGWLEGLERVG
jgi:hypothetical protein